MDRPSSHAIIATLSLPITSTYRMPDRQLVLGGRLGVGVSGEEHVGIQGALGLDHVHGSGGAFRHGLVLGVGGGGGWWWWLGM